MGRRPKVAKNDQGANVANEDLSESEDVNIDGDSPPPSPNESGKGKGIVSGLPTEEKIPENIDAQQLNSSPQPSSSKQTLEQKVDFLLETVNSIQASEKDYKTLYLESQKMVEQLTKENHGVTLKLESALAKVEVYDKMQETFGSLKELVFVSKLTKGSDVFAEFTSQIESGAPAVAAEPPVNASLPKTTSVKGTSPAVAAKRGASVAKATKSGVTAEPEDSPPGTSELRRSKRGRKKN